MKVTRGKYHIFDKENTSHGTANER